MPNLSNALKIQGWTSEAELTWLAEQASTRTRIVEVGSWKGRSTRALADNTRGLIYAVDTWRGSDPSHFAELADKPAGWLFKYFLDHMGDNVIPLPLPSITAVETFRKLEEYGADMIFIDAAHDYENVKADILAWKPLLKPGGLLCGHDFDAGRKGVVRAVRELFPNHKRIGVGSIWVAE